MLAPRERQNTLLVPREDLGTRTWGALAMDEWIY
jgi:hypothetical protein